MLNYKDYAQIADYHRANAVICHAARSISEDLGKRVLDDTKKNKKEVKKHDKGTG